MNTESSTENQPLQGTPAPRDWLTPLTLAVLRAAIIAVFIVRLQAAPVPLERDEGEYALMGQLILDGIAPYNMAANMKLPGIYYAYSAIMALLGQTPAGIHIGLMVVNLLSTLVLYLLARRPLGAAGAAITGVAFIVTSMDSSVLGLFAHSSQFVVLFSLAGIWLLQESTRANRRTLFLWAAGLCLGTAVLMKQHGAVFALFGFLWFFHRSLHNRPRAWRRLFLETGCLAGGIILPYVLVLALMAYQGVLSGFWFWTVTYALSYASEMDLRSGIASFWFGFSPLIESHPVLWSAALVGLIGSWCTESGRRLAPFLLSFFLFSFHLSGPLLSFALFRAAPAGNGTVCRPCRIRSGKGRRQIHSQIQSLTVRRTYRRGHVFADRCFFPGPGD